MDLTLLKKLNIKESQKVLLLNCPLTIKPMFDGLDVSVSTSKEQFDSVIVFIENKIELGALLPQHASQRNENGKLWIAYPKQSGSISSDLNRDIIWEIVNGFGLNPNRLISLNKDWSVMSLVEKGTSKKPSKFGQDPPGVDRKTKTVIPPNDLQKKLEAHPDAKQFFHNLAFSHKREYVGWIHDAKKEETRKRRIDKTVELLLAHKKTK